MNWKPLLNWELGVSTTAFGIDSNCVHSNDPYPYYIYSLTNPPKLSIIMSLMVQVFDACVSNLTYSITLKYISILFPTMYNPRRAHLLFSINTHFFNDSICLLNDNHFHLIDHTTMNLVCRFHTFMLYSFYCFIMIYTIQQMTPLSN